MKKLLIVTLLSCFGLNAMEEGDADPKDKVGALVTSYIRPDMIKDQKALDRTKDHGLVSHHVYREQANVFIRYANKHPFPSEDISTEDSGTLCTENGTTRGHLQDLRGHFRWNALKNTVGSAIGGFATSFFSGVAAYCAYLMTHDTLYQKKIGEIYAEQLQKGTDPSKLINPIPFNTILYGSIGLIGLTFTLSRIRDWYRDCSKLRTTSKLLGHNERIGKQI